MLDVPSLDFRDLDAVRGGGAGGAKSLGFAGKAAIHPSNVDGGQRRVHADAGRNRACREDHRRLPQQPHGMAVVDGKLVEKPVVRAMERILALRAQPSKS